MLGIHSDSIRILSGNRGALLGPHQSIASIERDPQERYLPPTRSATPTTETDNSESTLTDLSSPSSQFALSPATWTPEEVSWSNSQASPSPTPKPHSENMDMANITGPSFTGKPEDQDLQDFINRLEHIILMKTRLTEPEKVRFLQLWLKTKSPADAWFSTLLSTDKASFAAVRTAFELRWPVKPITVNTTAEKQALLDGTVLKLSDLGRRVIASKGVEEELSHIVWADKVKRLAADIPDTNNLLVASTQKKNTQAHHQTHWLEADDLEGTCRHCLRHNIGGVDGKG
ncbi:hypothetical protein BYT27DRAFT_7256729 [Phlegmacium glaucopus]|nr:hypothetical protein BYT27DRAFT_7256729 [Phlegmacium glaucopus]